MADLRPLYCALPQEKPYVAVADLDDGGEKFLDGAIRRRKRNFTEPSMRVRYGYLMAENQPPDAANSEKQVLDEGDRSSEVEIVGGDEEDENGDRVFEIYFSQDNCNYIVQLAFGPEERSDDEDEMQEEGEGGDYYSDDDEEAYEEDESDDEEETDEDDENNYDELTERVFELYFPQGGQLCVVRLVFDREEGDQTFLGKGEEFLFGKLQRIVEFSYEEDEEDEDEVPAIDNNSSYALPEVVLVPENLWNLIEEDGEKRSGIEYPKMAKGSKIEIAADPSSGTTCVDDTRTNGTI